MKHLDLPYPHGYLVWKGKQKAIVSDVLLQGRYLITTGNEAYGFVILDELTSKFLPMDFKRLCDEITYKPFELRLYWPDVKVLYSYIVKNFEPFKKPKLFKNEKIINYKSNFIERKMISQASELPAKIILDPKAICAGKNGFNISKAINDKNVIKILEAVYETKVSENNSDLSLPIYQLALVRSPRLVVGKEGE